MLIREIMNHNSITIPHDSSLKDAAKIVSETQSSDLMVVSDDGDFIGVLSEGDLIRVVLPKFDEIMKSLVIWGCLSKLPNISQPIKLPGNR